MSVELDLRLYQSFTDLLRTSLAKQGFDDLGGAYGYVFRALVDEEPSQRELALRLGITDQWMAKILSEMVERGYVERRPDPEDSRVKRLRLASRGKSALGAARRFHAAFEQQLGRRGSAPFEAAADAGGDRGARAGSRPGPGAPPGDLRPLSAGHP